MLSSRDALSLTARTFARNARNIIPVILRPCDTRGTTTSGDFRSCYIFAASCCGKSYNENGLCNIDDEISTLRYRLVQMTIAIYAFVKREISRFEMRNSGINVVLQK